MASSPARIAYKAERVARRKAERVARLAPIHAVHAASAR